MNDGTAEAAKPSWTMEGQDADYSRTFKNVCENIKNCPLQVYKKWKQNEATT